MNVKCLVALNEGYEEASFQISVETKLIIVNSEIKLLEILSLITKLSNN